MGIEDGLFNNNIDETGESGGIGSKESAKNKLDALLRQIEQDGGIQGTQGKYTFDQIKTQIDLAFASRGANLSRVTNTDHLREILGAAVKEQDEIDALKDASKRKPINWDDKADHLQALEEQDSAHN